VLAASASARRRPSIQSERCGISLQPRRQNQQNVYLYASIQMLGGFRESVNTLYVNQTKQEVAQHITAGHITEFKCRDHKAIMVGSVWRLWSWATGGSPLTSGHEAGLGSRIAERGISIRVFCATKKTRNGCAFIV